MVTAVVVALLAVASPAPKEAPSLPGPQTPELETPPANAPTDAHELLTLTWNAPPSCPDEASLRQRIERYIGQPLDGSHIRQDLRAVAVEARVTLNQEGWQLELAAHTASGPNTRLLTHRDGCEPLLEAASVIIAIAIDPMAFERLAERALEGPPSAPIDDTHAIASNPSSPPAPAPTTTPRAESVAPKPPPLATATRRTAFGLRALVGLSVGDRPQVGVVTGGVASLHRRRGSLEVTAHYGPSRFAATRGDASAGADISLWTLGARGCGVLVPHKVLEIPLCGGWEAGALVANGRGFRVDSHRLRLPFVAPLVASSLVVLPTAFVALSIQVEAFVPLLRPRIAYDIDGQGHFAVLHRASPVGFRSFVALEFRMPRPRTRR